MTNQNQRHAAIRLYKELHRIGRDYPNPRYEFHHKLRGMFENPQQISDKLKFLEYIKKETLSLISLAKYREMKRRYGSS
ncbi:hypothetical protein E3P92_00240 [Wallemia ichthyophaga]|uniref:LYR motif-containing protein 5 n=1 Tax=Wallemia ichthyophaga TaxID=245174 RepID=A0A4T0KIF4_WALIC|nr:hypothetical protein E3P91_00516 [Wallemia ichthyophaga]TIA84097.1 hypothetical protein E3P98_00384 [Wallemia ichthyophaga]TIA93445.1 hypothetical protein E3P97_00932 [Wallemia ichthyophaga]TIA96364.1 hypothetical protein E3P96_03621 [Wallemia ichthyophaga]TIB00758.1 hypothetical protein E3P95_01548 [Wallemia ichthyophaga]